MHEDFIEGERRPILALSVHDAEPDILVRDIMSRPPITARETETVAGVSKLMGKHDIGCVIIVDKAGNPAGIITERDIVQRVAARNVLPSELKVVQTMSKPVATIAPGATVNDAAKLMNHRKIRRLAVIDDGKLVGIVTMKDILQVTPAIIDLASEKSRAGLASPRARTSLGGYCDECEAWSDNLVQKDGIFLCQDCSRDLGQPEEP
ncbi:MAG TPA: CBS domain-containing protein [Candidatus Bathyarchaeia archaeon]|nr:CBS domain-containing protein [Candidatus Bathyarchaeia archaeon]